MSTNREAEYIMLPAVSYKIHLHRENHVNANTCKDD